MSERAPYGDNWSFYRCERLGCGLYFYSNRPIRRPILKATVVVPRLNDAEVEIVFTGLGEAGYQNLLDSNCGIDIFPVDLFHDPHKIDPHPSRSVTAEMYERWEILVETIGNRTAPVGTEPLRVDVDITRSPKYRPREPKEPPPAGGVP
jgi:hypothetical protein